jgi:hypothetical protein
MNSIPNPSNYLDQAQKAFETCEFNLSSKIISQGIQNHPEQAQLYTFKGFLEMEKMNLKLLEKKLKLILY